MGLAQLGMITAKKSQKRILKTENLKVSILNGTETVNVILKGAS